MYEEKELLVLQQILFFRELEFPLEQIRDMMNAKTFSARDALVDQRKLLVMKKKRLEKLIHTVDSRLKGGEKIMDDTQLFGSFDQKQLDEYKEEARKRWGNTKAFKQSEERTKHWTKEDYKKIAEEGNTLTAELAKLMDLGAADDTVQKMIAKHYQGIGVFYDCSYEMYRGLGQLYVDDKRFSAYYDKFRPGMARFMRDAIAYFCDLHK